MDVTRALLRAEAHPPDMIRQWFGEVGRSIVGLNTDQWTASATVATAAVADLAAAVAYQQVRQARQLREEQAQPVVVVDFEPNRASWSLMDLVIRNTGLTIAHDVEITFDPPLSSTLDDGQFDLSNSDMLVNGIPTLPPGKEMRALFDAMHERLNPETKRFDKDGHAAAYEVVVTFRGSGARSTHH